MVFFKKDKNKPIINWDTVDECAKEIYKLLHDKKLTFLELDCILNLVTTECNNSKYAFLLGRIQQPVEQNITKDVPSGMFG